MTARLMDRRLTAQELDEITAPYVGAMNVVFRALEERTLEIVEEMTAAGATEAELLKAIDNLFK